LLAEISDPSFADYLRKNHHMDFCCVPADRWHDYSDTDCVLAVRGKGRFPHKPATKLSNAWLANVPFIGSPESACLAQGRPGVDFLTACTREEAINALIRLRDDPDLRVRIVSEGSARSRLISREAIAARWQDLLNDSTRSAFPRWKSHHPAAIRVRTAVNSLRLKLAFSLLGTSHT
jgi:hypothetical protein